MSNSWFITGGAGFIGSNFLHFVRNREPERELINADKLTYAGNLENLQTLEEDPNYHFLKADVTDHSRLEPIFSRGVQVVINFAAETHVDRSIEHSKPFVQTNIEGTRTLLELARQHGVKKFIQISTDEVYGELEDHGQFTPESPLEPTSPYSASKAGADLLARSFWKTYDLPVTIIRSSNNYGPFQFPEKFIPLMIINALQQEELPIYGDGSNVRDWMHVNDFCRGIYRVLQDGKPGQIYHFGGNCELTNLEVVNQILDRMDRPESLISFVEDRPGHDFRYAMDFSQTKRELGWEPTVKFSEGLQQTIDWYLNHKDWLKNVQSGEHQTYYERVYDRRDQWISKLLSDSTP